MEPGENYYDIDWPQRLLRSLNRTFDREPGDTDFIVSIEANGEMYVFDRKTLAYKSTEPRDIVVTWEETWREDF